MLPWRYDQWAVADPYRVWLSEVMLQQTVVKAVIPYFDKFTSKWPSVEALATASQDDVMDAWAGLGYYSRARNLHKGAKQVVDEYGGVFPGNEKDLLKLSGVGAYTAAAITSIAFNKPANIIDGNVERVMARIFALPKPLKESKKEIKLLASQFIGAHEGHHSDYSQSLMELGATVCTPTSPKCVECPVSIYCRSYELGTQDILPVKSVKKIKPKRYGYAYLSLGDNNDVMVERRGDKGLLANTIGFPTVEWLPDKTTLLHHDLYNEKFFDLLPETVKHVFTHFELELFVYQSRSPLDISGSNRYYWENQGDITTKLPTVFKKVYNLLDG